MITTIITQTICAFVGTLAFSVLFNTPKRCYLSCGTTGAIAWFVYIITAIKLADPIAIFLATVVTMKIAKHLSIKKKCPKTVFIVVGIFPLIPSASVYDTIYALVISDSILFSQYGMVALQSAIAIVLGIVFMSPKKPVYPS